jgi:hypothetical protein
MSIELDRRFVEFREDEKSDPEALARFGRSIGTLGWTDLLASRRVVLLAEAGSGKTTEMKARALQQSRAGERSFYATVEDVGRKGLAQAMRLADRARLADWLSSDKDGWLFIDSVDEAKHSGVRLPSVLQALAEGISGAERRAHIVLSGRYTDWQFRHDLAQLKIELAIPADERLPPAPTPDELVVSTLHHEKTTPPPPSEEPIVVVMAGLDEARIRQFAQGKQVENLDTFIAQIGAADLWQFARRPLDLDWLVQFWHNHKRLGTLSEILPICISERLQESNLDRARQDSLDVTRASRAVERIGAAMAFGHRDTIAVPDSQIDLADNSSLIDLADALPDWSPQDRDRLLTRAVFDPATFGRARIHNDNEGAVRSYLAARWLQRLRGSNLSQQRMFDLLFAEEYGQRVVRPSMLSIAAWLSLWDESVAKEVLLREPFLLLDTGDPSSLTTAMREALLRRAIEEIAADQEIPSLDGDNLKRFCRPDLAPTVRKLWEKYDSHKDVRRFLLRVIWLGQITQCSDLAVKIALNPAASRSEALFAGRALMATAAPLIKEQYAHLITDHAQKLTSVVVWNAADELFPQYISVDDLLKITSTADVVDKDGGLGFDWHGPRLVSRISSKADLEKVLVGFLRQLGGSTSANDRDTTSRERVFFPVIAAAAERLLELSALEEAPLPAIDAAIRLGESARASRIARESRPDLIARLQASTERRRSSFWRFTERLAIHSSLGGHPIQSLWDLQMLGWTVMLSMTDIDWLLADAPSRRENERELAINTAMAIMRDSNYPKDALQRILEVANPDPVMDGAVNAWLKPREKSPELLDRERRLLASQHRTTIERAKDDQSWIDFAAKLRANPTQMRSLRPTTSAGCDAKLFHLWSLLNAAIENNSRYSIHSVAALEPMIGAEATEGFRLGLIAHWRSWTPWLHSKRANNEQSQIRSLDSMGLAGITLEQYENANWATELGDDDARLAAEYATLELNGFPHWLSNLARAKPRIVENVLLIEARAELDLPSDTSGFGLLQNLARGEGVVAELAAPFISSELERRPNFPSITLSHILDIVVRAPSSMHDQIKLLLRRRVDTETDPARNSLYLAALFTVDGALGTKAVFEKLKKLKPADRPVFAQRALSNIFGRRYSDEAPPTSNLPLPNLEQLVLLAFETVRLEDDNAHPSGVVYSPDERDDAESARGAAFNQLLNTPGRAGFNAIMRLTRIDAFPISQTRLRQFAKDRAAKDSEFAPWTASEVVAFERTAETEPQTPRELQLVGLRRLADMQYDLINDDFQQGKTLAAIEGERAVQNFIADRLRLKQGRSFSVEREVHVADEKEPDVRLRAKATDASLPIEIKVAESWTLEDLEDALETQLCSKYLRAREARHGILLLVHQTPRQRGWTTSRNKKLAFEEVVVRLRKRAANIAGSAVDAPQPEIVTLDVTSFATRRAAKKGERSLIRGSRNTAVAKPAKRKPKKPENSRVQRSTSKPRSSKR